MSAMRHSCVIEEPLLRKASASRDKKRLASGAKYGMNDFDFAIHVTFAVRSDWRKKAIWRWALSPDLDGAKRLETALDYFIAEQDGAAG